MKRKNKMMRIRTIQDLATTGNFLKNALTVFAMLAHVVLFAQEDKQKEKEIQQAQELVSEAAQKLQKDKFSTAEADYRRAIALNPASETAKYNLANAYYNKQKNGEAIQRYKQASAVATEKAARHKAFHNLGNTYMNEKKYTEAVEAYKNALRNNPTDDETRYNLALAKDMLEKNPPKNDEGGGDDNKQDDKKENEQNKNDQGDNKEGDKGDQKEDDNKGEGDEKEDKKEGENEKDKGKPEEPKDGEQKQQPQQPVPGQLSPQQVKSLLEAMNNEERQVQEKINAQKQKGVKVNTTKDW